ncbi:MAG: hypothetical protein AUJ71_01160 [Candidatus Omnitrophica bacterium CG1_02_49_16]|nr:MAG: hypothetical protein AUJ71_01160 [Candidatus Omnitrophica bacterium CG1_02_49_16]
MAKVSVGMPVYNGSRFLKDAIASVLNQTLQDFELIIVDDCSSDGIEDIVRSFADPRIKFFRNKTHLGLAANWNRCIELSKGGAIALFHQDDLMLPRNLEKKALVLEKRPDVGLVYSNIFQIDAQEGVFNHNPSWDEEAAHEDFIEKGTEFFKRLILRPCIICCPSVLARRECYERLGGFDLRLLFPADLEMWLRISRHYDVAFLAEPLIKYRWHEGNETKRYANQIEGLKQIHLAKMIAVKRVENRRERKAFRLFVHGDIAEQALDWACYRRMKFRETRRLLWLAYRLKPSLFFQKNEFFILAKLIGERAVFYFMRIKTEAARDVKIILKGKFAWLPKRK